MNPSMQEHLAQRQKRREERRLRDLGEQAAKNPNHVVPNGGGVFDDPCHTRRRPGDLLALDSVDSGLSEFGSGAKSEQFGIASASVAGGSNNGGNSLLRDVSQKQPQNQQVHSIISTDAATTTTRATTTLLLKPPRKDTKAYNLAPPSKDTRPYSQNALAPPSKDTRPYSQQDATTTSAPTATNTCTSTATPKSTKTSDKMSYGNKQPGMDVSSRGGSTKNSLALVSPPLPAATAVSSSARGREPKRGNLQRTRSRSLSDPRPALASDAPPHRLNKRPLGNGKKERRPTATTTTTESPLLSPTTTKQKLKSKRRASLSSRTSAAIEDIQFDPGLAGPSKSSIHTPPKKRSTQQRRSTVRSVKSDSVSLATATATRARSSGSISPKPLRRSSTNPGKKIVSSRNLDLTVDLSEDDNDDAIMTSSSTGNHHHHHHHHNDRRSHVRPPPTSPRTETAIPETPSSTRSSKKTKRGKTKQTPPTSLTSKDDNDLSLLASPKSTNKRKSKVTALKVSKSDVGVNYTLDENDNEHDEDDIEYHYEDHDDDDDDEVLFTSHRTPKNEKGSASSNMSDNLSKKSGPGSNRRHSSGVLLEGSASSLPHAASGTSSSSSQHNRGSNSRSPTRMTTEDAAVGWSMAHPDQVNRWKEKIVAAPSSSSSNQLSSLFQQQQPLRQSYGSRSVASYSVTSSISRSQRRRNSFSQATSTSFEPDEDDDWFSVDDRVTRLSDSEDIAPLKNMTRDEISANSSGNNNNKRHVMKSSKAQSMLVLTSSQKGSQQQQPSKKEQLVAEDDNNNQDGSKKITTLKNNETLLGATNNDAPKSRGSSIRRSKGDDNENNNNNLWLRHTEHVSSSTRGTSSKTGRSSSGSGNQHPNNAVNNKAPEGRPGRSAMRGNLARNRSRSLSDLQDAVRKGGKRRESCCGSSKALPELSLNNSISDSSDKTPPRKERAASIRRMNSMDPKLHHQKKNSNSRGGGGASTKDKAAKDDSKIAASSSNHKTEAMSTGKGESERGRLKRRASDEMSQQQLPPPPQQQQRPRSPSKSPKQSARPPPTDRRRGVARTRSRSLTDLQNPRRTHRGESRKTPPPSKASLMGMKNSGNSKQPLASEVTNKGNHRASREDKDELPPAFAISGSSSSQNVSTTDKVEKKSSSTSSIVASESKPSTSKTSSRKSLRPKPGIATRSKTEGNYTNSKQSNHRQAGTLSPGKPSRPTPAAMATPPDRPSLLRHRSNSLSDLRSHARPLRRKDVTVAVKSRSSGNSTNKLSLLDATEEELEIARLRAHIESLKEDLAELPATEGASPPSCSEVSTVTDNVADKTNQPLKSSESIIDFLKKENARESAERKTLREKNFDLFQENTRLEEKLEKTQRYYAELEDIHNAEVIKNEALLQNVPVFRKVIQAHETKLARRNRYVEFERQTTLFYQGRMRAIVRNFQSKCDDAKLVRTLEEMAGMTEWP